MLDMIASAQAETKFAYTLSYETAEDAPAIEQLLDRGFGPDRHAKRSYAYREGIPQLQSLCRVARTPQNSDGDGTVIGSIRYWPIAIGDNAVPALLLGPIVIDAAWQGQGVGHALMVETLDMAAWANHGLVLLVGDPAYYQRFGFKLAAPHGIVMPGENPARLQVLALNKDALSGVTGNIRRVVRPSSMADTFAQLAVAA